MASRNPFSCFCLSPCLSFCCQRTPCHPCREQLRDVSAPCRRGLLFCGSSAPERDLRRPAVGLRCGCLGCLSCLHWLAPAALQRSLPLSRPGLSVRAAAALRCQAGPQGCRCKKIHHASSAPMGSLQGFRFRWACRDMFMWDASIGATWPSSTCSQLSEAPTAFDLCPRMCDSVARLPGARSS